MSSNALGLELAADVLRSFGSLRLGVTGSSMMPAVQPGDVLVIRSVDLDEVSPGEIVLAARGSRWFAHRVLGHVRSPEPYLITRGDRLRQDDPPVFRSDLLGTVTSVERHGRPVAPVHWRNPPDHGLGRVLRFFRMGAFFLWV